MKLLATQLSIRTCKPARDNFLVEYNPEGTVESERSVVKCSKFPMVPLCEFIVSQLPILCRGKRAVEGLRRGWQTMNNEEVVLGVL